MRVSGRSGFGNALDTWKAGNQDSNNSLSQKNIGCGLAGGDWPTYKETILTFARRNRGIRVDIVELYRVEDSETDTSDPSDRTDHDRTPDPDDDEQDHDEEQEPEDEVEDEGSSDGNHNGHDDEPHDHPAQWEGCSNSSDGIG